MAVSDSSPEPARQRVVAIVGRPNVGKSALFNRLARRRIAIVHEESGVTRDRIACEVNWDEHWFELIDTGGVGLMDKSVSADRIEQGTREQVDIAIQDASVVIFVVDITAGIVPLDEEVSRLLHASGRKVFVAANKADNPAQDSQTAEFEALGFPVFPVSAQHNRGIGDLMDPAVNALPPISAVERVEPLKVAIVGRPNVGKSSYINALLGSERVIVSDVPGTTRDSIEVPFTIGRAEGARHYRLIDTAGMRKVRKVHKSVERFSVFRAEKSIARADVVVLMLDAAEGPSVQDKKIAAKIVEEKRGAVIVVNKWDLAGNMAEKKYENALRKELFFFDYVPVVFASAKSGYNVQRTVDVIDHVSVQVSTELTTGLLNRTLHDAFTRVQPPEVKRKRLKFYYCTQTGTRPIRIRLFVNDRKCVADSYKAYLENSLRRAFGLEGAPLILDFRSSHSPHPKASPRARSPRRRR